MLDNRISESSFEICDTSLSHVRLKNNKNYPWIILIPRVEKNITEIFQLNDNQQHELIREISHFSRCMQQYFHADKINVGALGNIVSQLHIHIIARFENDLSWPHSVWQANVPEKIYMADEADKLIQQLRVSFK